MENDGNEFTKQFIGSASANVVFMVGILIYKFIEGRCKHSRCSSNSRCLTCAVDNYDTERGESNQIVKNDLQLEKSLPELHRRDDKILPSQHLEALELRSPDSFSGDPKNRIMAIGENIV